MNLRLQEQLNTPVNDEPVGLHEVDELGPTFVKVSSSTEGKISIEPLDGYKICKDLQLDLSNKSCSCW